MRLEKFFNKKKLDTVNGIISARGSFGTIESDAVYTLKADENKKIYTYQTDTVNITCEFTIFDNGAILR